MTKLRPEFELLESHFQQLRYNLGVDKGFLISIRDHIRLCEHIAVIDIERHIITRTTYWWKKRASFFGMDMNAKLLTGSTKEKEETEAKDRQFLHSLGIAVEDPEDGA